MKIKHIKTGNVINLNYLDWYKNYIEKGIYKNFEIIDYGGVVQLHSLQENGEMKKQPFDSGSASNTKNQFPNKMFIQKNLSFETYDKWLVPLNIDLNNLNNSKKITTKKYPKRALKIKGIMLNFWKLISENKLISTILAALILWAIKVIFKIQL